MTDAERDACIDSALQPFVDAPQMVAVVRHAWPDQRSLDVTGALGDILHGNTPHRSGGRFTGDAEVIEDAEIVTDDDTPYIPDPTAALRDQLNKLNDLAIALMTRLVLATVPAELEAQAQAHVTLVPESQPEPLPSPEVDETPSELAALSQPHPEQIVSLVKTALHAEVAFDRSNVVLINQLTSVLQTALGRVAEHTGTCSCALDSYLFPCQVCV